MKVSNRIARYFYISFIISTFLFFLYYTFPLNVLKQKIHAEIEKKTGLSVSIGNLVTTLPFGVSAEEVLISDPAIEKQFLLNYAEVSISLLEILLGNISLQFELVDDKTGIVDLEVNMGIGDILSRNPLPKSVAVDAYSFNYGPLVNFLLVRSSYEPSTNPILSSFLGKIKIAGKLKGQAKLSLDKNNLSQSKGNLAFDLVDSSLNFKGSNLGIKDQVFTKANLKGSVLGGAINISNKSGLKSEELEINFNGNIILSNTFLQSRLDLFLEVFLYKDLYRNFSHMVTKDIKNDKGIINIDITGNLSRPSIQKKDL